MIGAASPHARANVHQSFTMIADASSQNQNVPRESVDAIRAKIRFWRATMRREAGEHENFFVAKVCDSESAQRAIG
jgi:hypothetical protein